MENNFNGLKVMVIDDSKTIRRTAETLLQKAGCEVVTAIDGFDALAKIVDNNPDIIFVDIMMPRLDGYQTCALIKNNPDYANKPVIMLSSKDGLFDKARGRIVGSDEYLTKPFSKDELFEAINQYRQYEWVDMIMKLSLDFALQIGMIDAYPCPYVQLSLTIHICQYCFHDLKYFNI